MDIGQLARLQEALSNGEDDVLASYRASLPQVVVIGSQSVGKSSLLENIVGIPNILPKGDGNMVTRCPVLLQLRFDKTKTFEAQVMLPDQVLDARTHTCAEPVELEKLLTKIMRSIPNWISQHPIIVKIASNQTPDLCLTDLPGLIRVSSADQPEDLDETIKALARSYCSSPSAIILAISSGNIDLANSDSLRIARQVDPLGERTIGVITKCDLVADTQYLAEVVKRYPLRLGYVCVNNHACVSEPLSESTLVSSGDEEACVFRKDDDTWFLRNNERFKVLMKTRGISCGTSRLMQRLQRILSTYLKEFAQLKYQDVINDLRTAELRLAALGECIESPAAAHSMTINMISQYTGYVEGLLNGKQQSCSMAAPVSSPRSNPSASLVGGARLLFVLHDWFGSMVSQIHPLSHVDDFQIITAIRNANGLNTSLFIPENAFESLLRQEIMTLEAPVLQCVQLAANELKKIHEYPFHQIPELQRYGNLKDAISRLVNKLIEANLSVALQQCKNLIQVEMNYINKAHPDFVKLTSSSSAPRSGAVTSGGCKRYSVCSDKTSQSGDPPSQIRTPYLPPSTFMSFWRRQPAFYPVRIASPTTLCEEAPSAEDPREDAMLTTVKTLTTTYFNIVKKTLLDLVPKHIMYYLVTATRDQLQRELITSLYREDALERLLEERAEVPVEREGWRMRKGTLESVLGVLNEIISQGGGAEGLTQYRPPLLGQ